MSVSSIECQIAKGQIGRYLAGDPFSNDAVAQLEGHIADCPNCQAMLSERKATLTSMLGVSSPATPEQRPQPATQPASVQTVSAAPTPQQDTPRPSPFALPDVTKLFKLGSTSEPKQASMWKPFVYSLGLVAVLGTMSLASKNLERLTGTKVIPAGEQLTSNKVEAGHAAQPLVKAPAIVKKAPVVKKTLVPVQVKRESAPKLKLPAAAAPKKVLVPAKKVATKPEADRFSPAHNGTKPKVLAVVGHSAKRKSKLVVAAPKPVRHKRKPHVASKPVSHPSQATAIQVYDDQGNPIR